MSANHGFRALAAAQRSLPISRMAELAEGPVEYLAAGDGRPAIVLLSGFGVPHGAWGLVFPELATISTVFAYDRLGVGASAAPRQPQTGTAVVDLLRATLAAAAIDPPYIMVGHGLGGLYAQLYARLFAQELAGVVLLESAHPDDDVVEHRFRFLPAVVARAAMATALPRRSRRNAEDRFLAQTVLEIEQAGPFPDVPMAVVTAGKTPSRLTTAPAQAHRHDARQRNLVALSALGKQLMAPRSGFIPQITDPDTVVQAVREVIVACNDRTVRAEGSGERRDH